MIASRREERAGALLLAGGHCHHVGLGAGGNQLAARPNAVDVRYRTRGAAHAGHVHVEGFGLARDLLADRTHADDREPLASEVVDRRRDRVAAPVVARARQFSGAHLPHQRKHQRQRLLGDREGAQPRHVGDDHP